VVAPDLPAHGASEAPAGALPPERVLAWLGELVEATCPEPPAVVGHLLGGAIAARFALGAGRLGRLVLVDALGLAPFQPAPAFGQAVAEFVATPTEAAHDRLWRLCAFDLDGLRQRLGPRWAWLRAYNLALARVPDAQAARHRLLEALGVTAIPPADLARITVPTTLIWGRQDLATPLAVAEAAGARHGWPLHVIEDAGDDPPLEQPEAFGRALHLALGA
jgi:pimeloyl-ACP methyl ester carboxylesterase